jgi:hypothetical protein
VLVADPGRDLAARVQQESRVLQPAHAEAESTRARRTPDRRLVRLEDGLGDRIETVVQSQIDQIGMEDEVDALRADELVMELLAEPDERTADAVKDLEELGVGPVGRRVFQRRLEVEDLVRFGRVGIEIGLGDGPAAEGMEGLRLEIVVIQGATATAPVVRAAAEKPQSGNERIVIVQPDDVPRIGILRSGDISSPPASISATSSPRAARARASVTPAGPPPTTQTSRGRSNRLRSTDSAWYSTSALPLGMMCRQIVIRAPSRPHA